MPWHTTNQRADCDGWAVVKDDDGSIAGCHPTKEAAEGQLKALYAQEPDAAAQGAVTGAADLPLADRDRAWNGTAAEGRVRRMASYDGSGAPETIDWSSYGRAFFYHDTEAGETLGAYKLGFADVVNGQLQAVPKGIFAVAAVLQGGRGGVDIPQAEQDRVKGKVAAYYRKMASKFEDPSIEPPWQAAASCSCGGPKVAHVHDGGHIGIVDPRDLIREVRSAAATEPFEDPFPVPEYPPDEWFEQPTWVAAYRAEQGLGPDMVELPDGDRILRLTVTDEGRVGGWFYEAGQCLVHMPDACPKPSPTGYAAFHQNDVVAASGQVILAGVIGNTHGHASPWANWRDAQRHYADPNAQLIIVRAGDDDRGGWIAGALVPGVTYGDVALIRRCALSGDWRPDFGPSWWAANGVTPAQVAAADGYDCIGPTLVTRPGLPLPAAQGMAASAAEQIRAQVPQARDAARHVVEMAESASRVPYVVVAASMAPLEKVTQEARPMAKYTFPDGTVVESEGPPVAEPAPVAPAAAEAPMTAAEPMVPEVEVETPDDGEGEGGAVTREEFDQLRAAVEERLTMIETALEEWMMAQQEQVAAAAAKIAAQDATDLPDLASLG